MERFNEIEYNTYKSIRNNKKLDQSTQEVIAQLHSKYFRHQYYTPCTCSAKTWQQWISQLNDIYEKGPRTDSSV